MGNEHTLNVYRLYRLDRPALRGFVGVADTESIPVVYRNVYFTFAGQGDKLKVASTKLLHTFHTMLNTTMGAIPGTSDNDGYISHCTEDTSNIDLFVYLFAPLANTIKESDLTFKLAR